MKIHQEAVANARRPTPGCSSEESTLVSPIVEEFNKFNSTMLASLIADIQLSVPDCSEVVLHLHEPKLLNGLKYIEDQKNGNAIKQLNITQPSIADHWLVFDLQLCSLKNIACIIERYETAMIYVPKPGANAIALAELVQKQTTGLASLFESKTYKNFLAMNVFIAISSGFYQVR